LDRVYHDGDVQREAKKFVRVVQHYDGLNGKVIQWTLKHGNSNHDPSVLAWILDPKGEELGRPGGKLQSPSAFSSWLAEQSRASFPLVDPARYKILRAEAKAIAARKKLGAVLSGLRVKAVEETGQEKAEAAELLAKLLDFANYQLERAETLKESSPGEALAFYKKVASMFKGDAVGEKAGATRAALKKDKTFQREVKAGTILEKMRALENQIKPKRPLTSPTNRKVVASLRAMLMILKKKFGDTKVYERAKKLVDGLGH
jgi:hypothetical protein